MTGAGGNPRARAAPSTGTAIPSRELPPGVPEPSDRKRVSRFRPNPDPDDPVYHAVPDDGLCLNVFLILSEPGHPDRVLLGRIDPRAPWETIGGMSRARIDSMGDRWMLPARQLFLFEDPTEAAQAIARDLLELPGLALVGPQVTSEAWERPTPVGAGRHWDLSFLFRGTWPAGRPLRLGPWRELAFLAPGTLTDAQVGRGHLDVLALAHPATGPVSGTGAATSA